MEWDETRARRRGDGGRRRRGRRAWQALRARAAKRRGTRCLRHCMYRRTHAACRLSRTTAAIHHALLPRARTRRATACRCARARRRCHATAAATRCRRTSSFCVPHAAHARARALRAAHARTAAHPRCVVRRENGGRKTLKRRKVVSSVDGLPRAQKEGRRKIRTGPACLPV